MGIYGPLRVNQPVELEIREPGFEGVYRSRVEGISGDNLTLGAPYRNSEVIGLPRGTEVTVSYFDQMAVYFVDCLVISFNKGHVPTIVLGSPINTKRIQRRNFVRLDARIPMRYLILDEDMKPVSEELDATTIDISGGGLMFTTNNPVKPGDVLEVRVNFYDGTTLTAIGKTLRVLDNVSGKEKKSVGVEFTLIEERERDKIIRFIFNQQRELRQRGLL